MVAARCLAGFDAARFGLTLLSATGGECQKGRGASFAFRSHEKPQIAGRNAAAPFYQCPGSSRARGWVAQAEALIFAALFLAQAGTLPANEGGDLCPRKTL